MIPIHNRNYKMLYTSYTLIAEKMLYIQFYTYFITLIFSTVNNLEHQLMHSIEIL